MSRVEVLEQEIKLLTPKEFAELRDRILELDWEQWDRQIERDAQEGKLDKLFSKALVDHDSGKSSEI
jgi:hypothetical protein